MSSMHDFDNDAMFGCDLRVCPPKPSPMAKHTAMTNEQHPITPPTPPCDLVKLWLSQWVGADTTLASYVATRAAQWGWVQRGAATEAELQQRADQKLDACCEVLNKSPYGASLAVNGVIEKLRVARRPSPPSLKEQALARLTSLEELAESMGHSPNDTIRRALEALPND